MCNINIHTTKFVHFDFQILTPLTSLYSSKANYEPYMYIAVNHLTFSKCIFLGGYFGVWCHNTAPYNNGKMLTEHLIILMTAETVVRIAFRTIFHQNCALWPKCTRVYKEFEPKFTVSSKIYTWGIFLKAHTHLIKWSLPHFLLHCSTPHYDLTHPDYFYRNS